MWQVIERRGGEHQVMKMTRQRVKKGALLRVIRGSDLLVRGKTKHRF
jgi:hypothetical protein